jgi:hypothetical protein
MRWRAGARRLPPLQARGSKKYANMGEAIIMPYFDSNYHAKSVKQLSCQKWDMGKKRPAPFFGGRGCESS